MLLVRDPRCFHHGVSRAITQKVSFSAQVRVRIRYNCMKNASTRMFADIYTLLDTGCVTQASEGRVFVLHALVSFPVRCNAFNAA